MCFSILVNFAPLYPDITANRNREVLHTLVQGVHDKRVVRVGLLMGLAQNIRSQLPKRFGDVVQAAIEAAFGKRLDVAMTDQHFQGRLLVAHEKFGGNNRNRHHFSGGNAGLFIVVVAYGFEQFVKKAIHRYNLGGHGRLR